jgi:hypothetical protein
LQTEWSIPSLTGFSFLPLSPHRHRRDEDLRPGLRSFPVGEHVIIYRIEGEDILILTSYAAAATLKHYSDIEILSIKLRRRRSRIAQWSGPKFEITHCDIKVARFDTP